MDEPKNPPTQNNIVRFGYPPSPPTEAPNQAAVPPVLPPAPAAPQLSSPPPVPQPPVTSTLSPIPETSNPPVVPPAPPPINQVPRPSAIPSVPSPSSSSETSVEVKRDVITEIHALLLTLTYLNEPLPQTKDKPKAPEQEDAFRLTRAFMKGCQEARLNSDQSQKLLDELLETEVPNAQPGQMNSFLKITTCIKRMLPP